MELPNAEQTAKGTLDWPHAPPHRLGEAGVYFLTARARDKRHLFADDDSRENEPGRSRLWQNFRETHLTFQRSYLARLHYVHQNAVHHGLVKVGSDWKWCSAKKFKESVTPAWLKTITSFKYNEIAAEDGDDD